MSSVRQHTILIVDDAPENLQVLGEVLEPHYRVRVATGGERALKISFSDDPPDLILLDVMMPGMSGYEVCRRLKGNPNTQSIPVIFVSAMNEIEDEQKGLALGAVDYLTKPIRAAIVKARVATHLALYDKTRQLERAIVQLEEQALELETLNRTLERRVQEGVAELDRLARLKRFFSPAVAELIVSGQAEDPLRSRRREIVVVFLDLRGFTAFSETADPEEVMGVLSEYHAQMGEMVMEQGGTIERFAGDGVMVFFNDPVPIEQPAVRAVSMAVAMQKRFVEIAQGWQRRGYDLGMGIGIAQGYATIGAIGFAGRRDYGAIGNVTNVAARLCAEAQHGQILISQRVENALAGAYPVEPVGELQLKGLHRPIRAFQVRVD